MKKLLLLSLLISGLQFFGQTVLESYPSSTASIYQTSNYINFNNKMYYFGRNPSYQWSLYSTDGTSSGNMVIKNIEQQYANVMSEINRDVKYNDFKIVYNNKLYFSANGKLWQSDGTATGTIILSNNNPKFFEIYNGKLFFTAQDSTNGREIWSTDGTVGGTAMVKDIFSGLNPSIDTEYDPHFTVFNNKLFFVANDGITGFELWSTDGSAAGTSLFKDIRNNTDNESNAYWHGAFKTGSNLYSAVPFEVVNNKMYFFANDDISYSSVFVLFSTDGTATGTNTVNLPVPQNTNLTINFVRKGLGMNVINNELFVSGIIYTAPIAVGLNVTSTPGIFKIDASNQVMQVGTNALFAGDCGSSPDTKQGAMKLFNGEYYFVGYNTPTPNTLELWKMNPTTFAFTQVSQPDTVNNVAFNNYVNDFSILLLCEEWNGKLYFRKANAIAGRLYSTSGTLTSTTLVARQLSNGFASTTNVAFVGSAPQQLNNFGSGLYFNNNILQRFYDPNLLSTKENTLNKFLIFPNPTSSQINLTFENNLENAILKITSITGQTILEKQNISGLDFNIDVSELTSGLYLVQVINGEKILNSKFIKQ